MVEKSFDELESRKLNNIFLTLQTVMGEILLKDGSNDFKIIHMSKAKLERDGRLPTSIKISDELKTKIEGIAMRRHSM